MAIILGIESTAHTFGVGVVKNGKVLANSKKTYTTEKGGIIPVQAAKHHFENKNEIYFEALDSAGINEEEIDAVAFSQGPGLSPCLLEGMRFAKELADRLKKPIIPVNHCIAHLEIGRITGAKDPVMLYVSGANTQIIAYASGKYRIFGETLDIGVGNFIDTFARYAGIGFPGGPVIAKLAEKGKKYIELPYKVKGMDVALSGILTNLKQKLEKINKKKKKGSDGMGPNLLTPSYTNDNHKKYLNVSVCCSSGRAGMAEWSTQLVNTKCPSGFVGSIPAPSAANYTLEDLSYSLQETVFAMLVETAERALAHTGKKELLLGGGVACNKRLQEMCKIMCRERGAKLFVPENSLLVDNATMIAFTGEIMFKSGIKISYKNLNKIDIKPRQRTDEVQVTWK